MSIVTMDPNFCARMKSLSVENINHIFGFIYSPQSHDLTQQIRDVPLKMEKLNFIIKKLLDRLIPQMDELNAPQMGELDAYIFGESLVYMTIFQLLKAHNFYKGSFNTLNIKQELKKVWINFSMEKIILVIKLFDDLIEIANN